MSRPARKLTLLLSVTSDLAVINVGAAIRVARR
jgi:hypothetical protein